MPIDFLTEEQKQNYGRYAAEPNEVQLSRYFILDENDLAFIAQRRGDQNRLGIALQLTSVRFLGTLLSDLTLVPQNVQSFVARQLSISCIEILAEYAKREPTRWEHYSQIKKYYQYHEFGEFPWTFRLNRLLYTRAWISNERPSLMFDFATAWLVQHKILLPGATTLTRLITEIRERATNRLWQRLLALPNDEQKQQLDELLSFSEGQRVSMFEQLKKGPVTISSPAFNDALDRYNKLHHLGFQQIDFAGLPPAQLKSLARYANVTSVKKIARMPMQKRTAILIAFVKSLEVTALDEAMDVLDMLITNIAGEAKKTGQKKRLRTLKDLDRSSLMLAKACALLLDEATDDVHIRKSIFSCIPKARLAESVKMVNELARPADNNFHDEMIEQYGRVRRFLPRVSMLK